VSNLTHQDAVPSAKRTFSVRLRKCGPDYRTFVCQQPNDTLKCYAKDCSIVQDTRERSGPDCRDAQSNCEHLKCVQQQQMSPGPHTTIEEALFLDDLLTNLPIPANIAHELKCMVEKTPKRYACLWCSTASVTMHLNSTVLIILWLDEEPQTARDCTSERDTIRSNG